MSDDQAARETEQRPAMEVHLGEISGTPAAARHRHCIIWINGKRWEGNLAEVIPDSERG
jgi:hypothetical protein